MLKCDRIYCGGKTMIDFAKIEKQALSMDRSSSGRLASTLLRSLDETNEDPISPDEIENVWLQELRRRSQECDDDPSVLVSFEDVMQRLRDRD